MGNDDIYALLITIHALLLYILRAFYVLCGLLVVKIFVNAVILRRVVILLGRMEKLLGIVETHAQISDSRQDRVERAAATAATQAAVAREEIPRRVAELLGNNASALSGDSLPVVPPEPQVWKPGDKDRRGTQGG